MRQFSGCFENALNWGAGAVLGFSKRVGAPERDQENSTRFILPAVTSIDSIHPTNGAGAPPSTPSKLPLIGGVLLHHVALPTGRGLHY